ncbi:unnamed protein product [Cuscuta campestris]|uniref:Uncharacterized protein n=1 Tax=Cuscuta campestris TaxID=132261 RepID=A0A484LLY4_9ASTE|nr:unnamed protein product [Cuscuta campestris]
MVCNSVKKRWRYDQNTADCPIVKGMTKLVNFNVVFTPVLLQGLADPVTEFYSIFCVIFENCSNSRNLNEINSS